jgi:dipeptidyl aminopeptidase/acylaminoacyl peptidase
MKIDYTNRPIEKEITTISLNVKNTDGDNLITDFRYPKNTNKKLPLVVFCHGFKGFKDWGCFPYMLDSITEEDVFTVSFNFSYNGTGDNAIDQTEFTRLDLFAQNTFSRELDDLGSIINYLYVNSDKFDYDINDLTLVGHSRGGGISIIKTAEDNRVKKLVVLSSVSDFNRYSKEQKEKWKKKGYLQVLNTRTKQKMRMNYTLMEDLINNNDRLDLKKAIARINVPILIIHGKEDLSVNYTEAETLYEHSKKDITTLKIYPNTGHTFGAAHPFKGTSSAIESVIWDIIEFTKGKTKEEDRNHPIP